MNYLHSPGSAARCTVALSLCLALTAFSQAQTPGREPARPAATANGSAEATIEMNAFRVSTDRDYGYRKMSSVTSSRSGEEIAKMPQAIEVVSGELLQDFLANNGNNAFRYSSSVSAKE